MVSGSKLGKVTFLCTCWNKINRKKPLREQGDEGFLENLDCLEKINTNNKKKEKSLEISLFQKIMLIRCNVLY